MKLTMHVVDAFTDTLFSGNQAAVIVTPVWLPEPLMQQIATENNLSETAFCVATTVGEYQIRWFSPLCEIDFCGHATLASAFVLFEQQPQRNELKFHAAAVGELTICRGEHGRINMRFPNRAPSPVAHIPEALLNGLSLKPAEVYQSQQAYFAIYHSEGDIRALNTNSDELKKLAPYDVVATAPAITSDKGYDFVSRYFWPANGGDEDPVTGSIHAGLAPFWAERSGKNTLTAYQASKRGGILYCVVDGDSVIVSGNVVKYLTGQIELTP